MYNEIKEVTGNLGVDVIGYLNGVATVLDDKLRCKRIENRLKLAEHIGNIYSNQTLTRFHVDSDVSTIKIGDKWYSIYQYSNSNDDWAVWSDASNIEIVLHPDWVYRDLLGAMALLEQGSKARFWNSVTISERSASELGHDMLGFKIKGVRLKSPGDTF